MVTRRHRRVGLAIAALLCAAGGSARADKKALDKAREAMGELRYEDAGKALDKAIKSGTNTPAEMVEIYLIQGEVKASLGDDDAAVEAFKRALVLDAGTELREGLSPKIREPFAAARRAMKGKKSLTIVHRIIKPNPPTIAVVVQDDPLKMLVGARIAYWTEDGGAPRSVAGSGAARIDLTLIAGAKRFVVAGIDKNGNRLVELGTESEPLTLDVDSGGTAEPGSDSGSEAGSESGSDSGSESGSDSGSESGSDSGSESASVSASSSDSGGSIVTRWWLWGGVAVVAGGVGVWAGISARSALSDLDMMRENSQDYEFSQARAVADRAESRARVANIAFAVSAAAAITAGVFWYLHKDDGKSSSGTALVPVLAPDHAGVAATLSF
ncbi:MAG TPA: tetratricopeptide repeat protein [Kofleriaceae bacterium]|nr:tetratricopeptide repeat protein [Kofleriaceae bacterium]